MGLVIGYFDSWERADEAVRALIADGAPREEINVIALEDATGGRREIGGMAPSDPNGAAAAGATTGAALGGAVGVAIGLGALVIPGVGAVIAAGPLISAIAAGAAGAAAGGVTGGLLGSLVDAGVPKDRAEAYAEGVRRGGVLVSVQPPTEAAIDRAERIMEDAGAINIEERGTAWVKDGWRSGADAAV